MNRQPRIIRYLRKPKPVREKSRWTNGTINNNNNNKKLRHFKEQKKTLKIIMITLRKIKEDISSIKADTAVGKKVII